MTLIEIRKKYIVKLVVPNKYITIILFLMKLYWYGQKIFAPFSPLVEAIMLNNGIYFF